MRVVNFVFDAAKQLSYEAQEDLVLTGLQSYLELGLVSSDPGLSISDFTSQATARATDDGFSVLLYIPNGTQFLAPSFFNLSYLQLEGQKIFVTSGSAGLITAFYDEESARFILK